MAIAGAKLCLSSETRAYGCFEMYVATLLTDPKKSNLNNVLVDNLQHAWGGEKAFWLCPGVAAEFSLPIYPDNMWQAWRSLQDMSVDLIVQPIQNRKKRLLLADMDSTMIEQECIDELAAAAGIGPKVAEITARAMNGELDFEAALKERVGLLKGLETSVIDTVFQDRISLMPGGRSLVATMKAAGAYAALVSGGFTDFTSRVASELGFDENRANVLLSENGTLTGTVSEPILGRDAKVSALNDLCERLDLSTEQVLAVGDGANDLGMLQLAGTGVALHAKPVVAEACDFRVNFGDLTALLYLQGYSKDEFVE